MLSSTLVDANRLWLAKTFLAEDLEMKTLRLNMIGVCDQCYVGRPRKRGRTRSLDDLYLLYRRPVTPALKPFGSPGVRVSVILHQSGVTWGRPVRPSAFRRQANKAGAWSCHFGGGVTMIVPRDAFTFICQLTNL